MKTDFEIATAVIEAVEKSFGVFDLTAHTRRKRIVKSRHLACYLIRELTDLSYPDIADLVGYDDHTSAIFAVREIPKDGKWFQFCERLTAEAMA